MNVDPGIKEPPVDLIRRSLFLQQNNPDRTDPSYLESFINWTGAQIRKDIKSDLHESYNSQLRIWHLMFCLEQAQDPGMRIPRGLDELNEKAVLERLYFESETYRILMAVKTWLETSVVESLAKISYTPTNQAFHKTLTEGQRLSVRNAEDRRPLDPDCVTRERVQIHQDDISSEKELLICIWRCLRSGKMEDAIRICRENDQAWRAALISGGSLGRYASEHSNTTRSLWKKSCYSIARTSNFDHERAIFGYLCGHVDAIMNVCETFEDRLWAFLHCKTTQQSDAYLGVSPVGVPSLSNIHLFFAPGGKGNPSMAMGSGPQSTDLDFYQELIKHLILGESNKVSDVFNRRILKKEVGGNADKEPNPELSFGVHLMFYLKPSLTSNGKPIPESNKSLILRYVQELEAMREFHPAVVYCMMLENFDMVRRVAKLLQNVWEIQDRKSLLEEVRHYHPTEVENITRTMVADIMGEGVHRQSTSEDNKRKIGAIETMFLGLGELSPGKSNPEPVIRCLHEANQLLKEFILGNEFSAAANLYDRISNHDPVSYDISNHSVAREFNYYARYIAAMRWHKTWVIHHGGAKNRPMDDFWEEQDSKNAEEFLKYSRETLFIDSHWLEENVRPIRAVTVPKILESFLSVADNYRDSYWPMTMDLVSQMVTEGMQQWVRDGNILKLLMPTLFEFSEDINKDADIDISA